MSGSISKVALLGATGWLGSNICKALTGAGYAVTAIQRKDSDKTVPEGIKSIKVDLNSKEELTAAFKGHDAVVSAVPSPVLATEKVMIDAALAASVKRIIPSEYSTNLESPLAEGLPIVTDKVLTRKYLTSVITSTDGPTTWSSVNNGPFFDIINYGALGPNFRSKQAVYHNGGANLIGTSMLSDIGIAVAKSLSDEHLAKTANQSVYMHSAAVSEKSLTELATKVTGVEFDIIHRNVEDVYKDSMEKWSKGDKSGMFGLYVQMMYAKGYGGSESFQEMSWNERLGLKTLTEADIAEALKAVAKNADVEVK